jgi:maltooligosyltrehalose trehalohydrolase
MRPPPWSLERGARVGDDQTVRFSVWAPRAERIAVRLAGHQGESDHPLERRDDGSFQGVVEATRAGSDYFYVIDGRRARPDPVSRHQPIGVHGPSRVVDPLRFRWSDAGWKGLEMRDLVIYELHVGAFSEAGVFEGVIERLPALRDLGVTAIELMPVAEFPGGRNWGYDGVHLYAPQSTYGGPEGLRRLVDCAHERGLAVILDVVYNHVGPEGNYLGEFGPYFTDRYRTPWGAAVNFDGPESDEVRRHFVDNALYWVSEYHIDGLRLDAVHGIFDVSAEHILAEIATAVHALGERLGRRTLVIAESDLNDPRIVRPRALGGFGLDGQWADDFHHAVHAALTGESRGYYADFGGVGAVAEAMRERFVLRGGYSRFRRRRHGAPAADVPTERFVVFTQNHDQVGNRAQGERLATLIPLDAQKLSAAVLLLSPYVPLLFMGQEYGETQPFLYFVSHGDPDLVRAVREGRRREFEAFGWPGEVPDPQAVETFQRSRIDWSTADAPGHVELRCLHRDLLDLRRQERTLWTAGMRVLGGASDCVALRYGDSNERALLAVFNFSNVSQSVVLEEDGPEPEQIWRQVLATDEVRYGGSRGGAPTSRRADRGRLVIPIPGYTAVVYRRT